MIDGKVSQNSEKKVLEIYSTMSRMPKIDENSIRGSKSKENDP